MVRTPTQTASQFAYPYKLIDIELYISNANRATSWNVLNGRIKFSVFNLTAVVGAGINLTSQKHNSYKFIKGINP